MRRITAMLLVASALIALNVGVVYAEPDNKNSYEVEMNCPDIGETFTLVIVSPNSSARHIKATTDNLILKSGVGTATIGGDTFPINFSLPEQSSGKPGSDDLLRERHILRAHLGS